MLITTKNFYHKNLLYVQNNLEGGDYKMANKNNNLSGNLESNYSNSKQQSSFLNATNESKSNSSKYKNVEPLPESSRPRRDGPGGEDGD